jgi:glyoxylase-like metal-dependent hydrolase (beta-lactamase superfamily II)
MHRTITAGLALVLAMASHSHAQEGGRLAAAANAMGAANLNSIEYTGSGFMFGFGQAYEPGERWPRFVQRSYTAAINYQTRGMRLTTVRAQGEHPPRGGAQQALAGEQRAVLVVSDKFAWQEGAPQAVPNPTAVEDRLRQLWTTPHGVIKAALANAGRVDGSTVTFSIAGRAIKASLNEQNLVEKVSFLSSAEVVGDYPVEITYSDYGDFGGVKFPRRIVQTEDGHPTLDITVSTVRPNATVAIEVPANVQQAPPPPPLTVAVEKLADGVWYLTTPNARSWLVEFNDHVVLVEGMTGEARSLAINAEIARLVPSKPLRYVINTHAHYDHAGGLRTYVAQGVTVVTHELNKPFFEKAWARPRTIAPDQLSKSPKPALFETVSDKKVMTDGTQTLELYHMKGTSHNVGNMIVFMPRHGLVFWGDGYNPPAGNDARDPARTPEQSIDLYRVITANNLDVKTIAPAHGAGPKPFDNLKKAIGLIAP